jgi:lipid-A-disaccharide synthase
MAPSAPRVLIASGEASGDLYAAELLRHLRLAEPELVAVGLGGDRLQAQGAVLLAHIRDLAMVGLAEVVRHLRRLRRVFRDVLAEVDLHRPDVAVLLDYPDFNLRLARELHRRGIPVVYFVSPQIWAWRRGRIRAIRATVARMLVLFPFEEPLYRAAGVPVTFVGHPLVELVKPELTRTALLTELGLDAKRPLLAVLPGSRPAEIAHNLPVVAEALRRVQARRPDVQLVLALAPALDVSTLRAHLHGLDVRIVAERTHAIVSGADAAIVASGTATVETAILGTPMVVVYRLSWLTYLLGRPFVSVPHYAMVNLIAGQRIVPELMQGDFTAPNVEREVMRLLDDRDYTSRMRTELAAVRARLGGPGASGRAAAAVLEVLREARAGGR